MLRVDMISYMILLCKSLYYLRTDKCNSITLLYVIVLIFFYLGRTSLHWAAQKGYTDIVKLLLAHGANDSTKTNNGKKDNDIYTYRCMYIKFISLNHSQDFFIYIFYLSIYWTYM